MPSSKAGEFYYLCTLIQLLFAHRECSHNSNVFNTIWVLVSHRIRIGKVFKIFASYDSVFRR
jgi:hypothetical protein